MKITKCLLAILLVLGTVSTQAYEIPQEEKVCKKPKFRTFEPEHLSEVLPESEISFHVSNWADPDTIEVTARKVPLTVDVINKNVFYVVKAKLPPSLHGTFARIELRARAKEGRCLGQGGWLLKIKEKTAEESSSESEETTQEE